MRIIKRIFEDILLIEPDIYKDERGFFMEIWNERFYKKLGLDIYFIQDNLSLSGERVLRGLHFQHPNGQGKLVSVLKGEAFDVVVDIRRSSPSYGQWQATYLSSNNKWQLYIPPGFAHGFCVTAPDVLFTYKCTAYYQPQNEHGILWNDPDINIKWPLADPLLSKKDSCNPQLKGIPANLLPGYKEKNG